MLSERKAAIIEVLCQCPKKGLGRANDPWKTGQDSDWRQRSVSAALGYCGSVRERGSQSVSDRSEWSEPKLEQCAGVVNLPVRAGKYRRC
jgi:hypothetical protein